MTDSFRLAFAFMLSLVVARVALLADSNMGLKMVKPVVYAGVGEIGSMYTSIPFFEPYMTAAALCTKLGLSSTGFPRAIITQVNPVTGVPTSVSCGTSSAPFFQIVPGRGIRIRQPNKTDAPSGMTLLGSHDNELAINVLSSRPGRSHTHPSA